MLHWNVSEQNRVFQEQRSGVFGDDSGGDEASIGSDDEGERFDHVGVLMVMRSRCCMGPQGITNISS